MTELEKKLEADCGFKAEMIDEMKMIRYQQREIKQWIRFYGFITLFTCVWLILKTILCK